jgi:hypothetical protein
MVSGVINAAGAVCFGITVGYITYRTLMRGEKSSIGDLTAVIGAIGGGAVTALYDPHQGDLFGFYAIGLLIGTAVFFLLFLKVNGRVKTGDMMGLGDVKPRVRKRLRDRASEREHM